MSDGKNNLLKRPKLLDGTRAPRRPRARPWRLVWIIRRRCVLQVEVEVEAVAGAGEEEEEGVEAGEELEEEEGLEAGEECV